ncbi:DUF2239 family protein [Bosea caraganae]|uniref:DUF2239 family protein n=1 Tax=Bosea caraganae TaxID=2763117 RepID=A0A370L6D0_9HYPH|nr:DUF2239 family protein [Bosea caraganae]RDJ23190.1 DUF2239 family protein [Bosea caraganae]RDJ24697.1 DUF2239 family protein [Bosea caraganae]
MITQSTCTAFAGERLLASGAPLAVALSVKAAQRVSPSTILIFDDLTGRQIDFDLRGSPEEIAARLQPPAEPATEAPRSTGRPKLGVVSREVTLLPRHWDWLAAQPGGASVTLRKLVEAARKGDGSGVSVRQAQEAADRFMSAMLGNQPGYEEASRALYAGDRSRFLALSEAWPADLRDHARKLAGPAFAAATIAD